MTANRQPLLGGHHGVTRRQLVVGVPAAAAVLCTAGAQVSAVPLAEPAAAKLIASATAQVGVTTLYDASYQSLKFPGGDVPVDRGVCTDVVVRAYRAAFNFDLQARVNADMRTNMAAYPNRWGAIRPDANIDHRRVPNLQVFLARQRAEQPRPVDLGGWQPGDLVTQLVPVGLPHIGIVSATLNPAGDALMVLHNIGRGTQLEDTLALFPITGRYRFFPAV